MDFIKRFEYKVAFWYTFSVISLFTGAAVYLMNEQRERETNDIIKHVELYDKKPGISTYDKQQFKEVYTQFASKKDSKAFDTRFKLGLDDDNDYFRWTLRREDYSLLYDLHKHYNPFLNNRSKR